MFSILISEKGGETKRLEFDRPEITIGRVQGNDIVLPKGNVSKRHSRIVFKDGKYIIVDLKSTNGTYVNGRKITAPLVVSTQLWPDPTESLATFSRGGTETVFSPDRGVWSGSWRAFSGTSVD